MIDLTGRVETLIERQEDMLGDAASSRAVTCTLRVSPDGSGADGLSWRTAYQTIQAALDAASTDANECTLILVAPHATFYDINTTGDPTWTGNYDIRGTHRIWAPIRNNHASATSVLNFSGKVSITDLAIFTEDSVNGVCFSSSGWRIRKCGFNSTGLTGAATSVHIDGSGALTRGGIMEGVQFIGHATHTTFIHIEQSTVNEFYDVKMHTALNGVLITDSDSDYNYFDKVDIGECGIGLNIDAGNEQHFRHITFHDNTVNVDDEVGNHRWDYIEGDLPITIYPDNLTGITVAANAAADLWGTNTSIRAAGVATKPFRVLSVICQPVVAQLHHLRLSPDAGTSHFDQISVESARGIANPSPAGTGYIFNYNTPISGSLKAASGGSDEMQVWLKIQEI